MNSFKNKINSFRGYDRVSKEQERLQQRRKSMKSFVIIGILVILLLIIIVAAVVGTAASRKNDSSSWTTKNIPVSQAEAIKSVCSVTQYPADCFTSLNSTVDSGTVDPEELFQLSMKVALRELSHVFSLTRQVAAKETNTSIKQALDDCQEMIDTAIDQLNDSISTTQVVRILGGGILSPPKIEDLRAWLSAVLTNMDTCLDGFEGSTVESKERMRLALRNSTLLTSNSLAIASKIITILQDLNIPLHRRLLGFPDNPTSDSATGFPAWLSSNDRKLLQDNSSTTSYDILVAKDGTGTETSIAEAIKKVPLKSTKRFIIRVKAGKYVEQIVIDRKRENVMLIGDGMDATIISGSLNVKDGTRTFHTAPLAVQGSRFIAKDIGFENTAGPAKEQAVAIRVSSDYAVFYRCRFNGYQDTLYAHSLRQFYRECTISGTVDFIFGNAIVVFQNCSILVRQQRIGQQNTVTAQGMTDPNQKAGISILGCQIAADPKDEAVTAPTYLGRPWKNYSLTVVMKTEIGGLVHPAGWLEWGNKPFIFIGEYQNWGAGAGTVGRVNWTGYHSAISDVVAARYTVDSFLDGKEWLPNTGVPFKTGL